MRLIDADRFLRETRFQEGVYPQKTLRREIGEQPTVDAVPVVRCKDCKYYDEEGYCWFWDYETGMSPNEVDADDFCSYGERISDGK